MKRQNDDLKRLAAAIEDVDRKRIAESCATALKYGKGNLMVLDGPANPGVLDFQDAVYGPITYDLVSLLRDAYVRWPEERVIDWAVRHWERARRAGLHHLHEGLGRGREQDLSGGVWQALICTAAGLAVAIPCYAAYNYLVSRVNAIVLDMEKTATEIVNIVNEPSGPRAS